MQPIAAAKCNEGECHQAAHFAISAVSVRPGTRAGFSAINSAAVFTSPERRAARSACIESESGTSIFRPEGTGPELLGGFAVQTYVKRLRAGSTRDAAKRTGAIIPSRLYQICTRISPSSATTVGYVVSGPLACLGSSADIRPPIIGWSLLNSGSKGSRSTAPEQKSYIAPCRSEERRVGKE